MVNIETAIQRLEAMREANVHVTRRMLEERHSWSGVYIRLKENEEALEIAIEALRNIVRLGSSETAAATTESDGDQ